MSLDREHSREREVLKHSHSFDRHGRAVPMWDSADPDRAPPPLPLNPTSSPQLTTRPNTSANIAAAAQALSDRARESSGPSPYTTNAMPEKSPERSLIKGAAHRRMQSLQTNSVRDLRNYLDGTRSPERSPERPSAGTTTPTRGRELDRDLFTSPPSTSRTSTPTPSARSDPLKDAPSLRPTSRPPPKAILGENTPPSATMLALQNMPIKEFNDPLPFANITNGNTTRKTEEVGAISTQILSLTTICTNLQREMAQLSRRSKDNATDLVSLKDATSTRDEDIRKTLRELVQSVNSGKNTAPTGLFGPSTSFGSREHSTPPPGAKSFSLPRIPSPGSLFDDRVGSPSPYSVEGVASVAMLEKIIREMVTKDGQEQILATLSTLFDKASKDSGETAKKVDDMCQILKSTPASRALVPSGTASRELPTQQSTPSSGPLARTTREVQPLGIPGTSNPTTDGSVPFSSPKAADFVSDEMIKLLKKIKESVTNSGGMIGEVKAQQRDLRGEVLHMGRDIGRKIDESRKPASGARQIEDGSGKQDIARIVQEGLADLKLHLDNAMREKRRQSNSTVVSRSSVNSQEVYDVVKHTLTERGLDRLPPQFADHALDKEAILQAVKEAYEEYKPDVTVEQFGLERDEILQCLKEGLDEHRSSAPQHSGMSKEEIMDTIHGAMRDFQPPPPINEANDLRDEVLLAVRECLDEFKPQLMTAQTSSRDMNRELDVTRQVILDAIKAGLTGHGPNAAREIEISRDDLFDAVRAGLESSGSPFGRYGEQVVAQLHNMVEEIREEFKDYSTANGRDTEQVLDAMKDGLETLRVDIEQYVDRAQDVTSKDEIVDTVRGGLEHLRRDVETYCAAGPQGDNALGRAEMIGYIKSEFEHLHDAINSQQSRSESSDDKAALLRAVHDGFEALKANVGSRGFNDLAGDEMNDAMKIEFDQLRDAVIGGSSIHKDEVIDEFRAAFDTLHGKIDGGAFAAGSGEEVLRSVREELEHLKETLATTMARSGGMDDSDAIREILEGMRGEQNNAAKETLDTIQSEFEHLRSTITSALVSSGGSGNNGDTIEHIQHSLDELREQLSGDNGVNSKEVLDAVQSEFASLRESLGGSLVLEGSHSEKEDILQALRSTLETVQGISNRFSGETDNDLLGAIRGEFEMLRSNIATGFSRSTQRSDTEDILETVRLGFDDLRSELVKKIENPEPQMKATGELLDALNEGLESLKTSVGKSGSSGGPIDMTVSYEILDTLKEGIAGLRTDIEKLKSNRGDSFSTSREMPTGNEVVLADDLEEVTIARDVPKEVARPSSAAMHHNDLEKVEVMLAQVQIKIDALDANISDPAFRPQEHHATSEPTTVDLSSIETLLKDMQATVDVIASRELDVDTVAKKEDTDAIETLLLNTKAKIDEMELPQIADAASREQLEAVESLVKSTREAIDDLTVRIDVKSATKDDVTIIEVMVHDLKTAMDDLKSTKCSDEPEKTDAATKQDLDVLGVLSLEIKEKLTDLEGRSPAQLPSKADFEVLTTMINDFRENHDKMRTSYENDISVTAKAFDDRKKEAEEAIMAIGIVRSFMIDFKDELKSKVEDSSLELTTLVDNFKILEKTIESNFNVTADIKELMEIVNREFDRVHGAVEDVKVDHEEKSTAVQEKHDEARQLAIAEICTKLDERFDDIITKYDEAQASAEAHATALAEKSVEQEAILTTTKEVAEDLRISVDTLGATITSMQSRFDEIAEKVSEDSQTVYIKMEEGFSRLDDVHTHASAKEEHQLTRDEVSKALGAINGLQGDVTEFHPKFMVTLQEVHALINQHYEQSQKAQEAALKAQELAQEQAKASTEHTRSITDEIKSSFSSIPALLPAPLPAIEAAEKYDDAPVHEKLDKLIEGVTETKEASIQLDRLDKIHQQVMATAAEVTEFVTSQTRLITEGHECKQKEAEEMGLLLERRAAEKEHLDNDIQSLNADKDSLIEIVETLRCERDAIAKEKARMAAELSALQTALEIRQEEMHAMETKADALERRILDGIMNQSRVLLMNSSANKPPQPNTRKVSNTSTVGPLPPPSAASQNLGMALKVKSRPSAIGRVPNAGSRRVLSLNPITHNTPTGAHGFQAANTARGVVNGFPKRSQSVRTNNALRKSSWNSAPDKSRSVSITSVQEDDKENDHNLSDIDQSEDDASETGTERRVSRTESGMTYGTGSYTESEMDDATERRTSHSGTVVTESDRSYDTGTGSYLTGSEYTADGRTSYGSTVHSTLGAGTVIDEEGSEREDEGSERGDEQTEYHDEDAEATAGAEEEEACDEVPELAESVAKKEMVVYAAPSDSGIGSDMPTAGVLSGSETDYFRRAAEDAASVL